MRHETTDLSGIAAVECGRVSAGVNSNSSASAASRHAAVLDRALVLQAAHRQSADRAKAYRATSCARSRREDKAMTGEHVYPRSIIQHEFIEQHRAKRREGDQPAFAVEYAIVGCDAHGCNRALVAVLEHEF